MIYDRLENVRLYFGEGSALGKALSWAQKFDASQGEGRHEIDGDNMYAMVMRYDTKAPSEQKFEAHQKYIDVQLLLEGEEIMDVSIDEGGVSINGYNGEKDAELWMQADNHCSVVLKPGRFAVLYPDDKHRPGCHLDGKKSVRKMVIKVKIAS